MPIEFKPAVRQNVGLLIALSGASGSGKTYSAMCLAQGMSGDKRFAVIDTEAGRALHYADQFRFDHAELRPPFTPMAYREAIEAAEAAGYPVILIDSMSHEYDGDGGLLEWANHLEEGEPKPGVQNPRTWGDNWRADWIVPPVKAPGQWKTPKLAHKQMMTRLLQCRAHLIFCLRAEDKIEIRKEGNKTVVIPPEQKPPAERWVPICEKRFMFEMTASFVLTPDAPGAPLPIKLQEQHRHAFPQGRPITQDAGRILAEWAHGGAQPVQDAREPQGRYILNGRRTDDLGKWKAAFLATIAKRDNADDLEALRAGHAEHLQALATGGNEDESQAAWDIIDAIQKAKEKPQ